MLLNKKLNFLYFSGGLKKIKLILKNHLFFNIRKFSKKSTEAAFLNHVFF